MQPIFKGGVYLRAAFIKFLLVQCIECWYALRFLASENHEACGDVCSGSHKARDGRKDAMASYTDSGWATDDLIAECLCFLMRLIFKGGLYLICYEFSAASIRGRPLFKGGLYQ